MLANPNDLRYFLEICDVKNISRAAERLGTSQPSLSVAVQRLEAAFDEKLLHRSKSGVTLTPAGEILRGKAHLMLDYWQDVAASVKSSSLEAQGQFVLGCHPSVALCTLGRIMPQFVVRYPKVQFRLDHGLSRYMTEGVISSRYDLAIVVNPVRHDDLVIHRLYQDQVSLWTAKEATQVNRMPSSEAVLIADTNLAQVQDILRKLKKQDIEFKRVLEVGNLEVIKELVREGAGIGILPATVAALFGESKLEAILETPSYQDEIALVYRVENRDVKAIRSFKDMALEVFSDADDHPETPLAGATIKPHL